MALSNRIRQKGQALPNRRHELFCRLFVFGHPDFDPKEPKPEYRTLNNATRAYMAAGYKSPHRNARKLSGQLMKNPDVQTRIHELRDDRVAEANLHLMRWKTMLVMAQEVLTRAMLGEEVTNQAIRAAEIVVDQSLGPSRFRFGMAQKTDEDGSIQTIVWAGDGGPVHDDTPPELLARQGLLPPPQTNGHPHENGDEP